MANIVKIYELKTLGYPQLQAQLSAIEQSFKNISDLKKKINQDKIGNADTDALKNLNIQLKDAKIKTAELRLERQNLINEAKAQQNINQQNINQQKAVIAGITAEAGSITNLINQRKLLQTQLKATNPNGTSTISFNGQNLNFAQATQQYQALNSQIRTLTQNMNGMQTVGNSMTQSLINGFNSMRGQLSQMIFAYVGWFAVFREASKLIQENVRLTDSFADMQIRIKGTKEDVEDLFEQLKKIDTRTSLSSLVDIANIVAKKGVAKTEIAALTAEFDKLNVVLGKEIGDPATATASIIKLITIFNDDKHVTAERVKEIGTELFKLTTTGVATGEFLVNFAERVGAVRGITGLTLPNILGMGAALQQLGQRTEVAGTAAVQLTTKLFSNIPKFALAAKVSVDEFRKTLQDNPFEALIQVARGLAQLSDQDIAQNFEEVTQAFGEVGIVGVRVKAVLGDIATNGNFVRQRMKEAAVTTADYANQSAAAELKQNTLAATLARVRKEFELIGTNTTIRTALTIIGTLILGLVSNLGTIIIILAAYAGAWTIANFQMVAATTQLRLLALATTFQSAVMTVANTFLRVYNATILLFTSSVSRATAATTLWRSALALLPLTLLPTIIGFAIAAIVVFIARLNGTTKALSNMAIQQQANLEINERASKSIAEQVSKLDSWIKVVNSAAVSADTKRLAMQKLIELNPAFQKALDGQIISLSKLASIYKDVRAEIELNAKAQAAASLTAEKQQDVLTVTLARQRIETEFARGKTSVKLTSSELSSIEDLLGLKNLSLRAGGNNRVNFLSTDYPKIIAAIKEKEAEAQNVYEQYLDVQSKLDTQLVEGEKKRTDKVTKELESSDALTIPELELLIKKVNTELETLREGDPKIKELLEKRDAFQKRLDALKGKKTKEKTYNGARLSGDEKDDFSILNSQLSAELSIEQARFAALQLDHRATFEEEEQYLRNIETINLKYVNLKIKRLESEKSLNAKEKEVLASLRKDRVDFELKLQEEIQAIRDKNFAFQSANLKTALDNQIKAIDSAADKIENDPTISATDRAQARLDADKKILTLQEQFNIDIDKLEKQLNQRSKENADIGAQTREKIVGDTIKITKAAFTDANDAAIKLIDSFRIQAAEATIKLLQSNKSATQIARGIKEINDVFNRQVLSAQVAELKIELDLYEKGYRDKLNSEKEYLDAKAKLKEAEAKLTKDTIDKELTQFERFKKALKEFGAAFKESVFGIKEYSKDAEGEAEKEHDAIEDALASIQQAITEAYEGYFKAEQLKIERAYDVAQERLDLEHDQVVARAQTQAEIESIDRQYAARKKALDKAEGEEQKRLALKKIAIDYGLAVIKSLAQYGLPLALLPIAASTLLYFVQKANIQQQQFEKGGIVPTSQGGDITGPSHKQGGVKFNYEAQGGELAIVNKESSQDSRVRTITGTNRQILSKINELGGGISFDKGASLHKRFENGGILGSSFPAPVYSGSNSNDTVLALIIETRQFTIEQAKRIDRLKVVQETKSVTDAQKKQVKQEQIGTL